MGMAQKSLVERATEISDQGTPENIFVPVVSDETLNKEEVSFLKVETRGRKKGSVAQNKPTGIPKKITKKEVSKSEQVTQLDTVIQSAFSLIALKGGMHWMVTPEESKQLAIPLQNLIEKYDLTERVSAISDPMALVIASITIVVPRVILSQGLKPSKQKKILERNGAINNDRQKQPTTSTKESSSESNGSAVRTDQADNTTHDGQLIKSVCDTVQTWY